MYAFIFVWLYMRSERKNHPISRVIFFKSIQCCLIIVNAKNNFATGIYKAAGKTSASGE